MGLFDFLGKKNNVERTSYRYQYTPEQEALVEQFIEHNFGPIESRINSLGGTDLKLELCLIAPNEHNPSYLLVTKGLGAYIMAMNDADSPGRLELILDSGEPWQVSGRDSWAVDLISALASKIVQEGLTLNPGKLSLSELGLAFDNCASSFMVQNAQDYEAYQNFSSQVALNSFEQVTFLLLADMDDNEDPECALEQDDDDDDLLDNVQHLIDLAPKFDRSPSDAYHRTSAFLLWAQERQLLTLDSNIQLNNDYVAVHIDELKVNEIFTIEGQDFVDSYYQLDERVGANYIDDIISLVWDNLGQLPPQMQDPDDSCLFLELDNETLADLFSILDERWDAFSGHHLYDNADDEELYEVVKGFLPDETLYFARTNDDYNINATFAYGHELNLYQNFSAGECPLVIELNYNYVKGLLSYLSPNHASSDSFAYSEAEIKDNVAQALEEVKSYLGTAPEILQRLMANNIEDLQAQGLSLQDISGNGEQFADDSNIEPEGQSYEFNAYWRMNQMVDPQSHETQEVTSPVAVTFLPVARPYQTLAYVPFVPTDCGMTLAEIMAIAAYFEERYQSYVGLVSVDTIEFVVAKNLSETEAFAAAQDLYAFCPTIFESMPLTNPTLSSLAAFLMHSPVWTCNFDPQEDQEDFTNEQESFSF